MGELRECTGRTGEGEWGRREEGKGGGGKERKNMWVIVFVLLVITFELIPYVA